MECESRSEDELKKGKTQKDKFLDRIEASKNTMASSQLKQDHNEVNNPSGDNELVSAKCWRWVSLLMQGGLGLIKHLNYGKLVSAFSSPLPMQGGLKLTNPPREEEWEKAQEIYLIDNELFELPEKPMSPLLLALYLQGNYKLREIPPSFFEHMLALQILNLSGTGINSLPESLFGLVGLKRLFLNSCHNFMMLSPKVGQLVGLEVLDLEGTEIISLPKEVKKLTNLTSLKVSLCRYMNHGGQKQQSNQMIYGGVISALSQLKELSIDVNPDDERWGISVEAIENEVCRLMHLTTLNFYFPSVELLSHFISYGPRIPYIPPLSHFKFIVGHHSERIMSRLPRDAEFELERSDRCLKYINGEGVPECIKKVLRFVTAFHLDRNMTVKRLSKFGVENMEQLKCCVLGECYEIQVIIHAEDVHEESYDSEIVSEADGEKRTGLESLEYLNIYYMKNLRRIWEGPVRKRCFSLLKSLALRTCPQLITIFTLHLLENLCSLEELKVDDCPAIKSLVSCENSAEHESSSSKLDYYHVPKKGKLDYYLPKLKQISLYYVPELVSISSDVRIAPNLEWLSFYDCPNLKSLSMEEVSSPDLKMITGETDWWEALEWRSGRRPDNLDGIFVPIKKDTFKLECTLPQANLKKDEWRIGALPDSKVTREALFQRKDDTGSVQKLRLEAVHKTEPVTREALIQRKDDTGSVQKLRLEAVHKTEPGGDGYFEGCISMGPWGGPGGSYFNFFVKGGIKQIVIAHGVVIDSIIFKGDNGDGVLEESNKFGGNGGGKTDKIDIAWPEEYLTSISGSYKAGRVASLCFITNRTKYGPFGIPRGTSFSSTPIKGGGIIGFHGRVGRYLDAIGVYVKPISECQKNEKVTREALIQRKDDTGSVQKLRLEAVHKTEPPQNLIPDQRDERIKLWRGFKNGYVKRLLHGLTWLVIKKWLFFIFFVFIFFLIGFFSW